MSHLAAQSGHLLRHGSDLASGCPGGGWGGGTTIPCTLCPGGLAGLNLRMSFSPAISYCNCGSTNPSGTVLGFYYTGTLGDYCASSGCCVSGLDSGFSEWYCPPTSVLAGHVHITACIIDGSKYGLSAGTPLWEVVVAGGGDTLFSGHSPAVTDCLVSVSILNNNPVIGTLFNLPGETVNSRRSMGYGGSVLLTPIGHACP